MITTGPLVLRVTYFSILTLTPDMDRTVLRMLCDIILTKIITLSQFSLSMDYVFILTLNLLGVGVLYFFQPKKVSRKAQAKAKSIIASLVSKSLRGRVYS
jgi:hypothetical protein